MASPLNEKGDQSLITGISENGASISAEEAALYDRQIRIWGADVQKALRSLRVLVIGLKGVGAEVCKNLILAGVKSVTMMDSEVVAEDDLYSNCLLYEDSVEQNRAVSCLKEAQALNPNVVVTSETAAPLTKPIAYYENFDVVCVTRQPPSVMVALNSICEHYKIKFYCADIFGMFGYFFQDLNSVFYMDEVAGKWKQLPCELFKGALTYAWKPKYPPKKVKLEDPSYILFRIMMLYLSTYNKYPKVDLDEPGQVEKVMTQLLELKKTVVNELEIDGTILSDEYLRIIFGEYGPSCSIIGGILTQSIVSTLSPPTGQFYNMFLFNSIKGEVGGLDLREDRSIGFSKNPIDTIQIDDDDD